MIGPIVLVVGLACVLALLHIVMQPVETPCCPPPPPRGYDFFQDICGELPKEIEIVAVDEPPADVAQQPPAELGEPYAGPLRLDDLVEGQVYRIETVRHDCGAVKTTWKIMRFEGFEPLGKRKGLLLHFGPRAATDAPSIATSTWMLHSDEYFKIKRARAEA